MSSEAMCIFIIGAVIMLAGSLPGGNIRYMSLAQYITLAAILVEAGHIHKILKEKE